MFREDMLLQRIFPLSLVGAQFTFEPLDVFSRSVLSRNVLLEILLVLRFVLAMVALEPRDLFV